MPCVTSNSVLEWVMGKTFYDSEAKGCLRRVNKICSSFAAYLWHLVVQAVMKKIASIRTDCYEQNVVVTAPKTIPKHCCLNNAGRAGMRNMNNPDCVRVSDPFANKGAIPTSFEAGSY